MFSKSSVVPGGLLWSLHCRAFTASKAKHEPATVVLAPIEGVYGLLCLFRGGEIRKTEPPGITRQPVADNGNRSGINALLIKPGEEIRLLGLERNITDKKFLHQSIT